MYLDHIQTLFRQNLDKIQTNFRTPDLKNLDKIQTKFRHYLDRCFLKLQKLFRQNLDIIQTIFSTIQKYLEHNIFRRIQTKFRTAEFADAPLLTSTGRRGAICGCLAVMQLTITGCSRKLHQRRHRQQRRRRLLTMAKIFIAEVLRSRMRVNVLLTRLPPQARPLQKREGATFTGVRRR